MIHPIGDLNYVYDRASGNLHQYHDGRYTLSQQCGSEQSQVSIDGKNYCVQESLIFVFSQEVDSRQFYIFCRQPKKRHGHFFQKLDVRDFVYKSAPEDKELVRQVIRHNFNNIYYSMAINDICIPTEFIFNHHSLPLCDIQPVAVISGHYFHMVRQRAFVVLARCPINQGCRYLSRGLDQNKVPANSAIHIVCLYDRHSEKTRDSASPPQEIVRRYYILRGSAPLYFRQPIDSLRQWLRLKPAIVAQWSDQCYQDTVDQIHRVMNQLKEYEDFRCIDLQRRSKGNMLSQILERMLGRRYENFDLNRERCRRLNQYVNSHMQASRKVLLRVNCLDSTDRTNLFISKLIHAYLIQNGRTLRYISTRYFYINMYQSGNAISMVYTATPCQRGPSYIFCNSYGVVARAINKPYDAIIGLLRYGRNRVQQCQHAIQLVFEGAYRSNVFPKHAMTRGAAALWLERVVEKACVLLFLGVVLFILQPWHLVP